MPNNTKILIDNPALEAAGFQCWQDGKSFEITKNGTSFGRMRDPGFFDRAVAILLAPICPECWEPKPEDARVAAGLKCGACAGYDTDIEA